jgi:uncharacterized MAPEG superfamily protein
MRTAPTASAMLSEISRSVVSLPAQKLRTTLETHACPSAKHRATPPSAPRAARSNAHVFESACRTAALCVTFATTHSAARGVAGVSTCIFLFLFFIFFFFPFFVFLFPFFHSSSLLFSKNGSY